MNNSKLNRHEKATAGAKSNSVVIISSGVDSAVCVDFYQKERLGVSGLHVNCGQPLAHHEAAGAKAFTEHYGNLFASSDWLAYDPNQWAKSLVETRSQE